MKPRPAEVEFFNTIMSSPHDILARVVDDDVAIDMDVEKNDLEEAQNVAAFTEKERVFDKTPLANKVPKMAIPQSKWEKLVANVAKVKANQVEINKKLDLVLELNKAVKMILDILSKKESDKHDIDFDATIVENFLCPPGYQFPPKSTPRRENEPLPLEIELTHGVHEYNLVK